MTRFVISISAFSAVVMLSGCGTAPAANEGQDPATQQSELSTKDLFADLEGAWYGEVPNVYRACFVFEKLSPSTPWRAQAISYWIAEGPEATDGQLTLSRYAPSHGGPALSVLEAAAPSSGSDVIFQPGLYLQGLQAKTKDLPFWRHQVTTFGDQITQSATGIQVALERTTLRVASFGGDMYCTTGSETTVCGTGGYRPFLMKRVKACPPHP